MVINTVGFNFEFEYESAHELLINLYLNSTFAKSMNMNLNSISAMSMNLNVLIKHPKNLIFSNQNLHCESSDLQTGQKDSASEHN